MIKIALLLAALAVPAARAADLPPAKPTVPYSATYKTNADEKVDGGQVVAEGDTIVVRVSGPRYRQESQIMRREVVIVDEEKKQGLEFVPGNPRKSATRFPIAGGGNPYIAGRSALATEAPKIIGTDKVAGQSCTVLRYGDPEKEGIAACVTDQGIVVKARLKGPNGERTMEAVAVTVGPQDPAMFLPPADFKVIEEKVPDKTG